MTTEQIEIAIQGFFILMLIIVVAQLLNIGKSRPKLKINAKQFLDSDMSDEWYERIYHGDKLAIKEAKDAWRRAGQQCINQDPEMFE